MSDSPLVCLSPGHNLQNRNQSPDGSYFEWEFNQDVCDKAHEMFKLIPGIDSVKTKEADTYPTSLQGRVWLAEEMGADIYLAQHTNARGTGAWNDTNGFSVYIYPGRAESRRLAEIAIKHSIDLLPMKNLGIKTANFYEIREPSMPAILFETGYHTNREDVAKLKTQEFRVLQAKVIVRTACEYLGVKYVEGDTIMSAKQHIVQQGDTLYRIARNNGIAQSETVRINPHIHDLNRIYHEHGGDIVFLTEPNVFEVEFAAMRREVIFCKLGQEEFDKLKKRFQDVRKELDAIKAEKNGMLNDLRSISNISMKYV